MQRAQQCVLRALEKFSECEQGETKAILVKKKKKTNHGTYLDPPSLSATLRLVSCLITVLPNFNI